MAKLQELENVFVDLEYWIPAWILHLNQSKCEVVRSVEAVFVLLVILHLYLYLYFGYPAFVQDFPSVFLISTAINVARSVEVGSRRRRREWCGLGRLHWRAPPPLAGRGWSLLSSTSCQLVGGQRGPVVTTSRGYLVTPRGDQRAHRAKVSFHQGWGDRVGL